MEIRNSETAKESQLTDGRKGYTTPNLYVYGDVRQLTKANNPGTGAQDGGPNANFKTST